MNNKNFYDYYIYNNVSLYYNLLIEKNMYKYISQTVNLNDLINTVANFEKETIITFER